MKRIITIAVCLVLSLSIVGLAGCSGSSSISSQQASTPKNPDFTTMTAEQVVNQFKTDSFSIGAVEVFSDSTDPNKLLGRPNQYTSKATFQDTRLAIEKYNPLIETDGHQTTDYGGTVEVFTTEADCTARHNYIQALIEGGISFNKMYIYQNKNVLLRVTYNFVPSQAAEYETELHKYN